MKQALSVIFLFCILPSLLAAQIGMYQHGSVVRMHMGDCVRQGFVASFGAPTVPEIRETCPEYTLVSDKVVFVIVGKSSNQLIPLAEAIDFRLHKNELAVRVDDAKRESKFAIKEMIVRSEWERIQRHIDQQLRLPEDRQASIKNPE